MGVSSEEYRERLAEVWEGFTGRSGGSQAWMARVLDVRPATVNAWCRGEVEVPGYAVRMLGVVEGELGRMRYWRRL